MRYWWIVPVVVAGIALAGILLAMPFGGAEEIAEEGLPEMKVIREPEFAGSFYPANQAELGEMVSGFLLDAKASEIENARALIVPHAGYIYSGQVAGAGFGRLGRKYSKVFILASNHNSDAQFRGVSVADVTHYKTPLGEVKVSGLRKSLLEGAWASYVPAAHDTHIIEVELPFLQKTLEDFEIIPIVTGEMGQEDIGKLADIIMLNLDEDTLIVVSSDLSHYHPYEEAVEVDTACIKSIESLSPKATECEMCGYHAVLTLMEIAKRMGWEGKIIDYKNSGDTSGDKSQVVGYSAIVFSGEAGEGAWEAGEGAWEAGEDMGDTGEGLNVAEKQFLLRLAREAIEIRLASGKVPEVFGDIPPSLAKVQGCFVTLNKNSQLRGCIGHIVPQEALYQCVIDNAVNAALNDPRFPRVDASELSEIEVEVSVLSVPAELGFSSPEDLLAKLTHQDGVVIDYMSRRSTYLPQVWGQIPDKVTFLESLCQKQGSPSDCWRKDSVRVQTYQADVFHEGEFS